jgi:hypothetical protein
MSISKFSKEASMELELHVKFTAFLHQATIFMTNFWRENIFLN